MSSYLATAVTGDYGGDTVTLPCSAFTEEQIRLMYRAVIANCPQAVNARQRYTSEEHGGFVFLKIVSSFKIKAD